MPRSSTPRHAAPATTQPEMPLPVDEPPAAGAAPSAPGVPKPPAVFRLGDYQVGEGFCPYLCGHPDVRY